ncbi:hypothetical protein [Orbus mooreae]|uniref:hypothetical protein n=1 Tax=Orbus mooreae TaxID=3074107 RepID=UPI00370DCA63
MSEGMTLFISITGMLISFFIPLFFISRRYPAVDIATLTTDSILLHYYSSIRFDDVITYEIRRNDINLTLRPGVIHGDSITFTGTGNPELFTPFFECLCSLISRWQYSPKVMPQINIKTTKKIKKNKLIQNDKNQSKAPQEYFIRGSKHGRIQGIAFILGGIFGIFCGFISGEFILVFMGIIIGMFGITLL